jgi:hypothetical protein
MNDTLRVVFDCNVFLQALSNPDGPAGCCVELALKGKVVLFVSPYILDEIRRVTAYPKTRAKLRLREDRVAAFLDNLPNAAIVMPSVPESWTYERDPADAHYVNLALAADAKLIVSRDKDLLDLATAVTDESRQLMAEHPDFRVLTPPQFLSLIDGAADS